MIRPAQPEDIPKILGLCKEFWEQTCADEYGTYDPLHTQQKLEAYMASGACFVTNNVTGFLLLAESSNLCNANRVAAEVAWYVTPGERGGAGIKLLNSAIRYCDLKGIKILSVMYMQSSMPHSIAKIYDKLGFIERETTYVRSF